MHFQTLFFSNTCFLTFFFFITYIYDESSMTLLKLFGSFQSTAIWLLRVHRLTDFCMIDFIVLTIYVITGMFNFPTKQNNNHLLSLTILSVQTQIIFSICCRTCLPICLFYGNFLSLNVCVSLYFRRKKRMQTRLQKNSSIFRSKALNHE